MADKNICPVCGYPDLEEPPYDEHGCSSFEICPSCGVEFGYDDSTTDHEALRERWVADGMKWHGVAKPQPSDWNPKEQLKRTAT